MIIRVIGDVHGKIKQYVELLHQTEAEGINKTVQIGDFGFKEDYDLFENVMADHLHRGEWFDSSYEFFPGNHDDYDSLPGWCWGDFGVAPDGFPDNIFFVRGAKSIDKNQRTPGRDWWPEEELNWHQMNECVDAYKKATPSILLSHTTGYKVAKSLFPNAKTITSQTPKLLDELYNVYKPKLHIFGHWHRDTVEKVDGMLCICLAELSYADLYFDEKNNLEEVKFQDLSLL